MMIVRATLHYSILRIHVVNGGVVHHWARYRECAWLESDSLKLCVYFVLCACACPNDNYASLISGRFMLIIRRSQFVPELLFQKLATIERRSRTFHHKSTRHELCHDVMPRQGEGGGHATGHRDAAWGFH